MKINEEKALGMCVPEPQMVPLKKNVELSLRLHKDKRISVRPRHCFYNAFQAVMYCREFCNATYVEGIAGVPLIEHGWIELNGEIIDPTLPDVDLVYFPGLRFTGGRELSKAIKMPKNHWSEDLPIFYRFGWGGCDSPEFMAARKSAEIYLESLMSK